jgi:methylated-DNA-[protein]-cysteine S-methyltransferase
MTQKQWLVKTRVGALFLVASARGLQGAYLEKQAVPMAKHLVESDAIDRVLARASRQLEEYFAGKRKEFELDFDVRGTAFQKKVWTQLSLIPFGQTCSYSDIAKKIKSPKAARAVGSANGKNPLCIIVPCHRVIAADGSLGGYSGGLDIKRKLLDMEGAAGKHRARRPTI